MAPSSPAKEHLLTYATHETEGLRVWRSSAHRHGWRRPIVAGLGDLWGGWKARASSISIALAQLDPTDVVLVTDAYDVCITNTPTSLRAVLGKAAILVGTESTARRLISPLPLLSCGKVDAQRARANDFGFSARLHAAYPGLTVNAGAFAGRAGALGAVLRSVALSRYVDDQAAWGAIADGEEETLSSSSSLETETETAAEEVVFDVEGRLVCNLSIGSFRELLSFALLPHRHVTTRVREALVRGTMCLHAPGSSLDGGVRYALLLRELGHAPPTSAFFFFFSRASLLSVLCFLLVALVLAVALWGAAACLLLLLIRRRH